MKHAVTLAFAAALVVSACAQQKKPTFDPARLSAHVKALSADEFEGRAPDSPGEAKTVEYLTRAFQEAGLLPGGDLKDGQYLKRKISPAILERTK